MPKIEKMFAFVGEDTGPDDEGIMAHQIGDTIMPLVGADMERIQSLLPFAKEVSRRCGGKPFKILEFSVRKDVTKEFTDGNV